MFIVALHHSTQSAAFALEDLASQDVTFKGTLDASVASFGHGR